MDETPFAPPFGNPALQGLIEPALPERIGWWPLAPGWWAVIAAILLLGAVAGYRWWKRWRRAAYRRLAAAELRSMNPTADNLGRMALILKLTALRTYPRDRVAALSGDGWLAFLDRTGRTDRFTAGSGGLFGDRRYTTAVPEEAEIAVARSLAIAWVEQHHADP